jgi:uncharacterized protein YndB with AHSA1/START domain
MAVFRLTQVIDQPVGKVFNTVVHIEDFPKWSPQNPSARRVSDGEIAEGSRFLMEIKGFGTVPQVLHEFEANRRVRIVPQLKTLRGGHRFTFTAERADRTRIDHEIEMSPQGIYRLMMPMMWFMGKRNLRITAQSLKAYLEREPSAQPEVSRHVAEGNAVRKEGFHESI